MASAMKGVPEGASVVIPRLFCRDVAAAIDFCRNAFQAVERNRRPGPDGKAVHALMTIGPAMIMFDATRFASTRWCTEFPQLASTAPELDGSSPVVIFVYVEDVDLAVEMTLAAGGSVLLPAQDQFWGDRTGWIMDPSGHVWTIASRLEQTSEDERKDRWSKILSGKS